MEHHVVGYCRVSSEEQDLKNQRRGILEYTSKYELTPHKGVLIFEKKAPLYGNYLGDI